MDQLRMVGEGIFRETEQGIKSLFQIYKEEVVANIKYEDKGKPGTYTPPEAFEIASASLPPNYQQNPYVFAIILLYHTLEMSPDNVVERLRPFLSGSRTKQMLGWRLIGATLNIAEDYLGLRRDTLYTPFTNKDWLGNP